MCGSRDLELVLQLVPTPSGDAYVSVDKLAQTQEIYPLDLFLCHGCGLSQLPDVIDPEILYREYIYQTSISLGLANHFDSYAEQVLRRINPPKGGLVVDFGSNDGTLLKCYQNRGMRVLGVEPALAIARTAVDSGVPTLPAFFTAELARKIKSEHGAASIVTANNVFANIDNLIDMAAGIRDLLAPDGVFVLETSYLVDVIEKVLLETFFHEHLSYCSVKPLDAFFRRNGMELIDVQCVPTKGGSLRCTVQRAGGPRATSPSVAEFMTLESSLGIHSAEPFKAFATRIEAVKKQLLRLLHDLQARQKTIAGYGASVGVTTLIYQFDLGGVMSFLVDDNPSRQSLFSPGTHLPVLPSEVLYRRKPGYVLILAWGYSEPIITKHQAFLQQGGRFIIPLPKIELR